MNETKTLHIFARGRVQGVGYREFVRRAAQRRNVSGWVRNRFDGAVEARASGSPGDLDALIGAMRAGPIGAQVRDLQAADDGAPAESGLFTIAPTC